MQALERSINNFSDSGFESGIALSNGDVQFENFLNELNEQQYKAVASLNDALLVLSGAGTGKTKVITTRIAYILYNLLAYQSQILAVTFSNRAANEMKVRLKQMMGDTADGVWLGTFHSICVRILRKHANLIGLESDFTILDRDDQEKLAKQILVDMGNDKKLAGYMIDKVSRLKDKCVNVFSLDMCSDVKPVEAEFFRKYQAQIFSYNAVDFSDLILYVIRIFQEDEEVLEYYRNKFRYILVDEYQDTNLAQYIWLRLLSPKGKGLCCVGDDDQSIYSWRGAEIGNILRFETDFPNACVLKLEQNYRSTGHILGAANGLIAANKKRHTKQLWTEFGDGDKVIVTGLQTGYDEARYVAMQIENMHRRRGINYKDMAVLVRASYQTREFEDIFMSAGIPYKVIGGPRFYERKEIRDILAYMRLVYQPNDGLAFERIINQPKRGIGETVINKLRDIALEHSCSMFNAIDIAVNENLVRTSVKLTLSEFANFIKQWRNADYAPATLAKIILEESGYMDMLKKEKTIESETRLENLKELITALESYSDLGVFLEHVSLVMDNNAQKDENLVNIMTLHSSKGLEFDLVFLGGLEEGVFPHQLSIREGNEEEERRLAYVGMTRARKLLFMTFAYNRRIHSQWQSNAPSRFLYELPEEHVFKINAI